MASDAPQTEQRFVSWLSSRWSRDKLLTPKTVFNIQTPDRWSDSGSANQVPSEGLSVSQRSRTRSLQSQKLTRCSRVEVSPQDLQKSLENLMWTASQTSVVYPHLFFSLSFLRQDKLYIHATSSHCAVQPSVFIIFLWQWGSCRLSCSASAASLCPLFLSLWIHLSILPSEPIPPVFRTKQNLEHRRPVLTLFRLWHTT